VIGEPNTIRFRENFHFIGERTLNTVVFSNLIDSKILSIYLKQLKTFF
jgi:hypothetical protein